MRRSIDSRSHRRVRRQLFVARRAQGRLLLRITLYCGMSALLASVVGLAVERAGWNPLWLGPAVGGSMLLLLPLVLYDAARVSNRLVGPFVRVQGALRAIANGDRVAPLTLRATDDWQEWIQEFNLMLARIQSPARPRREARRESEEVTVS